jgi:cytochrome P450
MTAVMSDKPPHVPSELVVDFDFNSIHSLEGASEDIHAAYVKLIKASPDIFWTPRNGGHWVVTRADDIIPILSDATRFSNRHITLPAMPEEQPRMIPTELDPPSHGRYRQPLVDGMLPKVISSIEPDIRAVAIEAIERLCPLGGCEFIEDFARVVPLHVYFRLVNLPLDDKRRLLKIADRVNRGLTAEERMKGFHEMGSYISQWVTQRRSSPGSDLLSKVVTLEIEGRPISDDEAVNYATVILFGGLETVATMMGFFARFLAENPTQRHALTKRLDDGPFVKNAVEELLRRHGVATAARKVTQDFVYKGVAFHAGDMVLPPGPFVGLDERSNPDPLKVDFTRAPMTTAPFGVGRHACPGSNLARRELQIFLEEWLPRIPEFHIRPGTKPALQMSFVNAITSLELVWP